MNRYAKKMKLFTDGCSKVEKQNLHFLSEIQECISEIVENTFTVFLTTKAHVKAFIAFMFYIV